VYNTSVFDTEYKGNRMGSGTGVDWIDLTQDMDEWRVVVNTAVNHVVS
jgi:hypothetical protein